MASSRVVDGEVMGDNAEQDLAASERTPTDLSCTRRVTIENGCHGHSHLG
jgi:hypothetical protein